MAESLASYMTCKLFFFFAYEDVLPPKLASFFFKLAPFFFFFPCKSILPNAHSFLGSFFKKNLSYKITLTYWIEHFDGNVVQGCRKQYSGMSWNKIGGMDRTKMAL